MATGGRRAIDGAPHLEGNRQGRWRRIGLGSGVVLSAGTALMAACYGQAPAPQPVMSDMHAEFGAVEDARAAAVAGDVEGVRSAARAISERGSVEGIPSDARPYLTELRRTARAIETEPVAAEAIQGTAMLPSRCGACHQEVGADVESLISRGSRPAAEAGHAMRMNWALQRLWDGLMVPSDVAWRAGANALVDRGAFGPGLRGSLADPSRADQALGRLENLSLAAEGAVGSEGRTDVLGEVLLTCSGCHQAEMGPRP